MDHEPNNVYESGSAEVAKLAELESTAWARYVESRLEHFEQSAAVPNDPALGFHAACFPHG
ncbi:MAG TPA: hypothetical protein VG722_08745 [Tepidisphaeraceae bacterium]|nr:hypothetical protein [Tepidisphaeraceae bacterium]